MGDQDTQATRTAEEKPETTAPAGGEGAPENTQSPPEGGGTGATEGSAALSEAKGPDRQDSVPTTLVIPAKAGIQNEPDPRDARITELEETVARLTAEHQAGNAQHVIALGAVQKTLTDSMQAAASRYKEVVLQVHTDLPPSLIEGGTIDQVEASIVKAKAIVEHVRNTLTEQAAAQIPGGAPVRSGPDVESMSPIDKIKYSLATRKK